MTQRSTSPLVTAIVTTYDRPELLRIALSSIEAEIYPNVEVVVAEDGAALDEGIFAEMTIPCRLVHYDGEPGALGVAGARNLGLEHARGEYVICLDDDDRALPNRIATLVDLVERHDADIAYGLTRKTLPDGSSYLIPTYPDADREITFADMLVCMPHVNATLVRTSSLRRAGGFALDTPHFDEWAGWLKVLDDGGRAYFTATAVAEWIVHYKGLTGEVRRSESMAALIDTLLAAVASRASESNRRWLERARTVLAGAQVETYDDWAIRSRSILPR